MSIIKIEISDVENGVNCKMESSESIDPENMSNAELIGISVSGWLNLLLNMDENNHRDITIISNKIAELNQKYLPDTNSFLN